VPSRGRAEPDDALHQRAALATADVVDEHLLDLEHVRRKLPQVAQRRVPGAEVVDRHAERPPV